MGKEYKIEKSKNLFRDLYEKDENYEKDSDKATAVRDVLFKLTKLMRYKDIPGIKPEKVEDYKKLIRSRKAKDFSLYKECFYGGSPIIIFGNNVCGDIINAIIVGAINNNGMLRCSITNSIILADDSRILLSNIITQNIAIISISHEPISLMLSHVSSIHPIILDSLYDKDGVSFYLDLYYSKCTIVAKNIKLSLISSKMTTLSLYYKQDLTSYPFQRGIMYSDIKVINSDNIDKVSLYLPYIEGSTFEYIFSGNNMSATKYQISFIRTSIYGSKIMSNSPKYQEYPEDDITILFDTCNIDNKSTIVADDVIYKDTTPPAHYPRFIDFYAYKAVCYRYDSRKNFEILGILKLYIPKDAIIRGSCSTKCRTNKALPVKLYDFMTGEEIKNFDGVEIISRYQPSYSYRINEPIVIEDFDESNDICSAGIHFFYDLNDLQHFILNSVCGYRSTTQGIRKIIEAESF